MFDESSIPTCADPIATGAMRRLAKAINELDPSDRYGTLDNFTYAMNERLKAVERTVATFTDPTAIKIRDAKADILAKRLGLRAHWTRVGIWSAYAFGAAVVLPLALTVLVGAWHLFNRVFLG